MPTANVLPVIVLRLRDSRWEIAIEKHITGDGLSDWRPTIYTSRMLPETVMICLRRRLPGVAIKYQG